MNGMKFGAILMAIVGVGLVTTMILPGRQTAAVVRHSATGFSEVLGTAMGRRS